MYARLCDMEILSSYVQDVSVGDMLTVQALVSNPLDWQHFYEKISTIKKGDKTDFMVVTAEGDRLQGTGDIAEIERWSNKGRYGFKVKISVKKQKSLTDRRTRMPKKAMQPVVERKLEMAPAAPMAMATVSADDIASFKEMLKGSLAMDISA
ncbi:hypothetical protein [Candidatus Nitrososphaera sp. FF02]|uniref:hypothetical protein n=1 Tax=Candidatus Nitrososphaera sp. FF02 TaxID=3398226 RepID=UPI0039E7498F